MTTFFLAVVAFAVGLIVLVVTATIYFIVRDYVWRIKFRRRWARMVKDSPTMYLTSNMAVIPRAGAWQYKEDYDDFFNKVEEFRSDFSRNLKYKHIERLITSNSPSILTAFGVIGVVGTALLTHKATIKAQEILIVEDARRTSRDPKVPVISRKETFELTWKCYVPPVISGAASIACIIGANRIGSKRAAAVAAAYTLSEKAYSEYREQVIKKIGENEERKIRDAWAQDRVDENPPNNSVIVMGTGDVLCMDGFSGRYLRSSVNALQQAVNDTNHEINTYGYASLTDFYTRIGLTGTDSSSELGWNDKKLMEIEISGAVSPEGEPCIVFHFHPRPTFGYADIHP